ncbi:carboxypeptidase-like regulatory domain-containing protein [Hymenobacter sp. BT175]|uniref:carboxypeptidase-like regulatory domain-containing protein n=1 Tax=Hymenobacter translucens TaxID=2886507 RepID=UPI001D0F17FF|nr:carboxypeptidase-like regulatory domain-containing protein [Hymenobacter translucens]MCC2545704.1 carboxypeptidase-like regulatory domain-containing protein [Hymenobacter translucens]
MRKAPFSLQIPSPCAERWDQMTPQASGRHCASCRQVVVDFTRKTDAEILTLLTAAAGRTCGRFRDDQLNRPLHYPAPAPASRWRATLLAAVTVLGLHTLLGSEARGQSVLTAKGKAWASEPEFRLRPAAKVVPAAPGADGVVRGRVVDRQTGEGLPGVTVLLKGTVNGTSADANGNFELAVGPAERQLPLVVSYIGYEQQEVVQPVGAQVLEVALQPDVRQLGGAVVIVTEYLPPLYTPRGLVSRVRSLPWRVRQLLSREN